MKSLEHLKKFDGVLVRNRSRDRWTHRLYAGNGLILVPGSTYLTTEWNFAIPFVGNEHLYCTDDAPSPQPQDGEWWKVRIADGVIKVVFKSDGVFYVDEKRYKFYGDSYVTPICKLVPAENDKNQDQVYPTDYH